MINTNKIDEKDLVFVNKPLTKQEELAFSLFLKKRKEKRNITASTKAKKVVAAK
jgi:hypothetical protein